MTPPGAPLDTDEPAARPRSNHGAGRRALALLGLTLAAAPSAFGACQLARLAELPVSMEDLRPVVPVRINGADARLIADSGAFYSVLSPGSAARFGLKLAPAPAALQMVGVGGEAATALTTVEDFVLAGAAPRKAEFLVGGSEIGNDVAGALGQNVLGIADVEYDLADGAIRLMRPKDCDAALRLEPKTAQFLEGRGFVRLRRGDYSKSASDYEAALHLQPKLPWSLYGHGVDQLHLGSTTEGQTDIAAATALEPHIAEEARQLGIAP